MLKSHFEDLAEKISIKTGLIFCRIPLSPNSWTILALVPAFFGFVSLLYGQLLIALVLFAISGLLDMVDGSVARVSSKVTKLGAFLDGVIDRYVEFLLYLGLVFPLMGENFLIPGYVWIIFLIFGALMPSFIRSYADHRGIVTSKIDLKRMGGLLERAERLGLLYVAILAGVFNIQWMLYIIILTTVLAHLTALQRIYYVVSYKDQ